MEKLRPKPGFVVVIHELPDCNFCGEQARYDFPTRSGGWAYGCPLHYLAYRMYPTLGVGKGQQLITENEADRS